MHLSPVHFTVHPLPHSLPLQIASDPVGYGFVIRGSNPVYVHSVDPSGPAAAVGLMVSTSHHPSAGRLSCHANHLQYSEVPLRAELLEHLNVPLEDKLHFVCLCVHGNRNPFCPYMNCY